MCLPSKLAEDFNIWCKWKNKPMNLSTFIMFFLKFAEFRALVDYRLKYTKIKFLRYLVHPTCMHINLYISSKSEIGGGLRFMHGFSTIIYCTKMGTNCIVNQQVTIGWNDGGAPTIGNNVWVGAGAKVLGPIFIGNDVIIGANAVVVKDVPSHSIVAGVPAKIIKCRVCENDSWKIAK